MKINPSIKIIASSAIVASSFVVGSLVSSTAQASIAAPCSPTTLSSSHSVTNITFEESMAGPAIPGLTGSGNHAALQTLIAAYNKSQSKVHVTDLNDTGGYADTWSKYQADQSNPSSIPQVVMFDQYDTQAAADSQTIIPVSTCLAADKSESLKTFVAKATGAYTLGKTIEGMPFSVSTPVMYYNKQAFVKAGITTPPTTMAQLATDQAKLQAAGYTNGVAIKRDPWITMTWLAMGNQPFINNGNGHTSRATAASFNTTNAVSYWNAIQSMVKKGALATGATGTINQAYANLFAVSGGQAGITFDTTAALGSIEAALPIFPNLTLGVAPLPTLTGSITGSTPPGGNGLFIPKHDTALQAAAAWDFIKYLTNAKSIAKWASSTGYLPIRTDSVSEWTKNLGGATSKRFAWYNVAYKTFSTGPSNTATAGPILGSYATVSNELVTALDALTQSPYPSASSLLSAAQSSATADILSYNGRIH